jgi:hypothetical protein
MADKKYPRKRAVQFHFMASDEEAQMIRERMRRIGISNIGAYLRKSAIDGYVVQLDLGGIKEFVTLLRRCSNNINQIAKYANTVGGVLPSDMALIKNQYFKLWEAANEILASLADIR